jgi:S-adenosylmethionine synthetase
MLKSALLLEYSDDNKPTRIDAIVISTRTTILDERKKMLAKIKKDIVEILIPASLQNPTSAHLFNDSIMHH